MPILGAHMSISGGYYKAVKLAGEHQCDCVQVFTKNNNQWRAKDITDEDVELFQQALANEGITHPLSHSSYLINLGSPDKDLWRKSLDGFVVELDRAERLGIPHVVVHPGSYTTSCEVTGIKNIVRALNQVHKRTSGVAKCLLETTAGQGSNLGWRFEHLADIIGGVAEPDRLGVCIDTCHMFAAGYPLGTEEDYRATMSEFNKVVGVKKIKAVHLNDSKREFGSRKDRHESIGQGEMGFPPFRFLLNDKRFAKVPMYLETPKVDKNGKDLDVVNLRRLRRLVAKA